MTMERMLFCWVDRAEGCDDDVDVDVEVRGGFDPLGVLLRSHCHGNLPNPRRFDPAELILSDVPATLR